MVQLELEPVDDDEAFKRGEGKEEEGGVGGETGESGRDLRVLRLVAAFPNCPPQHPHISFFGGLTKAAKSTHGASTNPVPTKLTNAPISFGSGSNVWNSSGWTWKAGSPCRGGRSFLFLLTGLSTDEGSEIEPRDCEIASSCVDRRRVTSKVPLEARRAAGGLAGFYR